MGVQGVSRGTWFQVPLSDGIRNQLFQKVMFGHFPLTRTMVSQLPGRGLFLFVLATMVDV